MTAEEWMNKINQEEGSEWTTYDASPILMERYASHKLRDLHSAIFQFRKKMTDIEEGPTPDLDWAYFCKDLIEIYDKHFGIVKV